jgi:hypothetical protein
MLGISRRAHLELKTLDNDNDDCSHHTAASLTRTSTVLQVFASMLSSVSHGPYNQWKKCFEFIEISLSWPDRDSRHEYRYVFYSIISIIFANIFLGWTPTFDRLVHLLEQNPIF